MGTFKKRLGYLAAGLAAISLAAGWVYTLRGEHIDTSSPAIVAEQFLVNIQNGYANRAYNLTSPAYQRSVSRQDFENNQLPALSDSLPMSRPQPSGPPAYSGTGNASYASLTLRIAKDEVVPDDYKAVIVLSRSQAQAGGRDHWQVDRFAVSPAGRESVPAARPK